MDTGLRRYPLGLASLLCAGLLGGGWHSLGVLWLSYLAQPVSSLVWDLGSITAMCIRNNRSQFVRTHNT